VFSLQESPSSQYGFTFGAMANDSILTFLNEINSAQIMLLNDLSQDSSVGGGLSVKERTKQLDPPGVASPVMHLRLSGAVEITLPLRSNPAEPAQNQVEAAEARRASRQENTPRPLSRDAEKKLANQILLECKQLGMSYKDINEILQDRCPNIRFAESTLRGRFRNLTKKKEERVRKPEWQDRDVSSIIFYERDI
jgi:hypothetical protein